MVWTFIICVCLYLFSFLSLQSHGFSPNLNVCFEFSLFSMVVFFPPNTILFAFAYIWAKKVCFVRIVFRYIANFQINLVLNATCLGQFQGKNSIRYQEQNFVGNNYNYNVCTILCRWNSITKTSRTFGMSPNTVLVYQPKIICHRVEQLKCVLLRQFRNIYVCQI